jgi:hypothetical protein
MKIYESLLAFQAAIVAQEGKIVIITLDKKGYKALQGEIDELVHSPSIGDYPRADSRRLFGIVVEVVKECPTCGQNMVKETR